MSTSNFRRELTAAAVAGACIGLLGDASNPALSSLPIHPVWAIALLLAARYGARGLIAIPLLTLSLVAAEWVAGGTGAAMLSRAQNPGDLVIWFVTVGIALVGASHERRKDLLALRLDAAELRAREAEAAVEKLSDAALALRDRCDRSQTSLVFLADVAARINEPDPSGAGQAALELAMARTGAAAGFVQIIEPTGRLRMLTSRGTWSADSFRPPALFRDLTAAAAIERRVAVAAHEVDDVRADDSDLVAPLLGPDGRVIGVLALRRVPYRALAGAIREDLVAVARWAAGPLARHLGDAGPAAAATARLPETKHAAT
jgi:hypothetical protein